MSEEIVSGTPAEPSSAPSTPAAATPAAPASPVATPQAAPAQATQSTPQAPEGWVPSYRIRESREAAQREARAEIEREKATARAEVERYRAQVLALTGVQPNQNQNPEIAAVRDQFGRLYPGLSKLEEKAEALEQLMARAQDLETQNTHYWETYARQSTTRLFDQVEKSLGNPLSEEAKNLVHSSFVGFLQSSPELERRYASDPTIVDEFAKAFTSQFIDPARRGAAASIAGRAAATAPLPQDTPSGAPRATPAPKLDGVDERANVAWARYQQLAKT